MLARIELPACWTGWLALLLLFCCQAGLWGSPPDEGRRATTPEAIWIAEYLRSPKPEHAAFAREAAGRAAADPVARGQIGRMLRRQFAADWIEPKGRVSSPLPLHMFDELAERSRCRPFGSDGGELVPLLNAVPVPRAWADRAFLDWLSRHLPDQAGGRRTVQVLLHGVRAMSHADAARRCAWLIECLDKAADREKVVASLQGRLQRSSPQQMQSYDRLMAGFDGQAALKRWRAAGLTQRMLRVMGDRLFQLPPKSWSGTGDSFERLVGHSSHSASQFLERWAGQARGAARPSRSGQRTGWDSGQLHVVKTLCRLTAAAEAYRRLQPAARLDWFLLLHQHGILPALHKRDRTLLRRSYQSVRSFDAQGHFDALFGIVRGHYYRQAEIQEAVFTDLLRRRARSGYARLVLSAALAGEFLPRHRVVLGRDCLADAVSGGGTGLDPAWKGGSRCCLDVAIALYSNAVPPKAPHNSIAQHLNSPLLGAITSESLRLLRREGTEAERVLKLLEPLARRMRQYRDAGADTAQSRPLQELERGVSEEVQKALEALEELEPTAADLTDRAKQAIQRYVNGLALAFRLRSLLTELLGRRPQWVQQARHGLRRRVFGLNGMPDQVLYWPPATTRFRARMLMILTAPLRECLRAYADRSESDAFWNDIYLPLVRVHGFLKVEAELAQQQGRQPCHLSWVLGESGARLAGRFSDSFRALNTARWLDADQFVYRLAEEHRRQVLKKPIWQIEPAKLFAGHWSANANLRVWRRLLAASPPGDLAACQLPAIAAWAVDRLGGELPPVGPTWPIQGQVPEKDVHEQVWQYTKWAANLVTAYEWQQFPFFRDERMSQRAEALVRFTESPETPFEFQGPPQARRRRVNGQLRRQLAELLAKNLDSDAETAAVKPEQVKRLAQLADVALFLPNNQDNCCRPDRQDSQQVPARLEQYDRLRRSVYELLYRAFGRAEGRKDRMSLFRYLSLVDVSRRRTDPPLTPPFEAVDAEFKSWAGGDQELLLQREQVLAERAETLQVLKGQPKDAEASRAYVDAMLKAIGPRAWSQVDPLIRTRGWQKRLELLDDRRVLNVLRVGMELKKILDSYSGGGGGPAGQNRAQLQADFARLNRFLSLIDYSVFFSRPDFFLPRYQERRELYLRALPRGQADGKQGRWRPALVVLAWFGCDLQKKALKLCKRIEPLGQLSDLPTETGNFELAKQVHSFRSMLFLLNDAIFQTLSEIARRDDAEAVFADFRPHQIDWRVINFRLLAETHDTAEASAESLSRDCFHGVLINLELSAGGRPPSDEELYQRLFQRMDYWLPPAWQRNPAAPRLCVDRAVLAAAQWAADQHMPADLRRAADRFLTGKLRFLNKDATRLLANAASLAGVLNATDGILNRVTTAGVPRRYRQFYDSHLTVDCDGRPGFSDPFLKDAAAPFFRQGLPGQRRAVERAVQHWRQWLRTDRLNKARGCRLAEACRSDTGRLLFCLVKGLGCPPAAPYIWQPVDRLRHEQGHREQAPQEAFAVLHWWLGLAQSSDPETIRKAVDPGPVADRPYAGAGSRGAK